MHLDYKYNLKTNIIAIILTIAIAIMSHITTRCYSDELLTDGTIYGLYRNEQDKDFYGVDFLCNSPGDYPTTMTIQAINLPLYTQSIKIELIGTHGMHPNKADLFRLLLVDAATEEVLRMTTAVSVQPYPQNTIQMLFNPCGGTYQYNDAYLNPHITAGVFHFPPKDITFLIKAIPFEQPNDTWASAFLRVTAMPDALPPIYRPPVDFTIEASGPGGAGLNYNPPQVEDNVDPEPIVECLPASGSTFPLGVNVVTCTATDAALNTSERTFTVSVVDTTPPDTIITEAKDGSSSRGETLTCGGRTRSTTASFFFEGNDTVDDACTFECKLDEDQWQPCSSPQNFLYLTDGVHTVEIRAIDTSGNKDPTPASCAFFVSGKKRNR
ncbi:MAG: HYR domain-containing protein [Planctomycetes bacterium]|nr:HYR domain-containing protein [Planctomycetota bacterium]